MKTCPNCHFESPDEAAFCPKCGAPMDGQPAYQPEFVPKVNPYDHTKDFEAQDIADGKLYALSCYLLSVAGILIALIGAKDSPYVRFHLRNSLKIILCNAALALVSALLCWTIVVPIAGAVFMAILFVVRLVAVVDVCKNQAIEPWLIRSLKFLN